VIARHGVAAQRTVEKRIKRISRIATEIDALIRRGLLNNETRNGVLWQDRPIGTDFLFAKLVPFFTLNMLDYRAAWHPLGCKAWPGPERALRTTLAACATVPTALLSARHKSAIRTRRLMPSPPRACATSDAPALAALPQSVSVQDQIEPLICS
jgi:hypothetical protein